MEQIKLKIHTFMQYKGFFSNQKKSLIYELIPNKSTEIS